jgi:hypothetical protein
LSGPPFLSGPPVLSGPPFLSGPPVFSGPPFLSGPPVLSGPPFLSGLLVLCGFSFLSGPQVVCSHWPSTILESNQEQPMRSCDRIGALCICLGCVFALVKRNVHRTKVTSRQNRTPALSHKTELIRIQVLCICLGCVFALVKCKFAEQK